MVRLLRILHRMCCTTDPHIWTFIPLLAKAPGNNAGCCVARFAPGVAKFAPGHAKFAIGFAKPSRAESRLLRRRQGRNGRHRRCASPAACESLQESVSSDLSLCADRPQRRALDTAVVGYRQRRSRAVGVLSNQGDMHALTNDTKSKRCLEGLALGNVSGELRH